MKSVRNGRVHRKGVGAGGGMFTFKIQFKTLYCATMNIYIIRRTKGGGGGGGGGARAPGAPPPGSATGFFTGTC